MEGTRGFAGDDLLLVKFLKGFCSICCLLFAQRVSSQIP